MADRSPDSPQPRRPTRKELPPGSDESASKRKPQSESHFRKATTADPKDVASVVSGQSDSQGLSANDLFAGLRRFRRRLTPKTLAAVVAIILCTVMCGAVLIGTALLNNTVRGTDAPADVANGPAHAIEASSETPAVATSSATDLPPAEPEIRRPKNPVSIKIVTPEPGFIVLVDNRVVLDSNSVPALTPCLIDLDPGLYNVRVARKGWRDMPRELEVVEGEEHPELRTEPVFQPFESPDTTFEAPYLNAPVGQPILLETLSRDGIAQDPFVSPDGQTIWFAADGPEGRGIYVSTRSGPYAEWDAPRIMLLSRGTDLPASPSATIDGLQVAYCMPGKTGRVWGLIRQSMEGTFDDKNPLAFEETDGVEWPVAQLSADGKRLYARRDVEGRGEVRLATRYILTSRFHDSKKQKFPGQTPCLSADELRQYEFNGRQLLRYRRAEIGKVFGPAELLAEVAIDGYQPHPARRQFWVSDDEEWMYYADDPTRSGKLYVIRLSAGPRRGLIVRGHPLPATEAIAQENAEREPIPATEAQMPLQFSAEDFGKSAPLDLPEVPSTPDPYAAVRQQYVALVSKRDYPGAEKLLQECQTVAALNPSRQLLEWDRRDLQVIQQFWAAVRQSIEALPADSNIRISGSVYQFQSYRDDVITARASNKSIERPMNDLSAGDLVTLADKSLSRNDPAAQLAVGVFLYFEGKSQANASQLRLERAGPGGSEFLEHQAARQLAVARQELARQNLASVLQQIDELTRTFPKSAASNDARKLRSEVYQFVKWQPRGNRTWGQPEPGTYEASSEHQAGAWLISERAYADFDLTLEWKVTSPTGQGGVYFHYPGSGKPLETGFKIQLSNDAGLPADRFTTGSLFSLATPSANAAKVAGEWNTLTMQVRGDTVLVTINGQSVLETQAIRKGSVARGFVALDGEAGGIIYRKVLLVDAVKNPPDVR